jgi:hypothetical protein
MIRYIIPLAIVILLLSACSTPTSVPVEEAPVEAIAAPMPRVIVAPPLVLKSPPPAAARSHPQPPAKIVKSTHAKALKHPILVKHQSSVSVTVHIPSRATQNPARKPVKGRHG